MPAIPVPDSQVTGRLILVPTPIGNLGDITDRAKLILQTADLIAVEDANHSRPLLSNLGCTAPLLVYHEQGSYKFRIEKLRQALLDGKKVALISSAGTPGISDPGFAIVRDAIDHDIPVECLPGATALIPALVVSGLPSHRFLFEGFLPHKGRQTRLKEIAINPCTTILYESPQRLVKLLEELITVCGPDRNGCVVRELSKVFEEVTRGSLTLLKNQYEHRIIKGEIVVLLSGYDEPPKQRNRYQSSNCNLQDKT